MKKMFLVLSGILFWGCFNNGPSRIFVPDVYKNEFDMDQRMKIYQILLRDDPYMSDLMLMEPDSQKYISLMPFNLRIRNVLTRERVKNVYDELNPSDREKFALYTVNHCGGGDHMLLYNHGDFTIILLSDYPEALRELISYFKKHKDLDARLLPLCVQEATKLYVANRRSYDEFGPWRHWWGDEADSLGRVYNQYLTY